MLHIQEISPQPNRIHGSPHLPQTLLGHRLELDLLVPRVYLGILVCIETRIDTTCREPTKNSFMFAQT